MIWPKLSQRLFPMCSEYLIASFLPLECWANMQHVDHAGLVLTHACAQTHTRDISNMFLLSTLDKFILNFYSYVLTFTFSSWAILNATIFEG